MYTIQDNYTDEGLYGYDTEPSGLNSWWKRKFSRVSDFGKRNLKSASEDAKKFARENIRLKNINLKNAIEVASWASLAIPGAGAGAMAARIATKAGKLGKVGRLVGKGAKYAGNAGKIGKAGKTGRFLASPIGKGVKKGFSGALKNGFVRRGAVAGAVALPLGVLATTDQVEAISENTGVPVEAVANTQVSQPIIPQALGETNVGSSGETNVVQPTQAQIQTISQVKNIPVGNLTESVNETLSNARNNQFETQAEAMPSDAQIERIAELKNIPAANLKEAVIEKITDSSTNKNSVSPMVVGLGIVAVLGIGFLATQNNKK